MEERELHRRENLTNLVSGIKVFRLGPRCNCQPWPLFPVEKLFDSSDRRADNLEIKKGEPVPLTESMITSVLEQFKEVVKAITTDASFQAAEIERVERLYADFKTSRAAVSENEVISTAKSRLRALADEKERISYFENAAVIEHRAWLAPRTRSERHWLRLKEWKKEILEYQQRRQGGRDAVEDL
ncbi:hypothetical protein Aperf_G00000047130 [Anoplocephala perfoliata]